MDPKGYEEFPFYTHPQLGWGHNNAVMPAAVGASITVSVPARLKFDAKTLSQISAEQSFMQIFI